MYIPHLKRFICLWDAEAETPILWQPQAELTHWKRPWCWERLGAGGEGDDRGWDGWMASPTRWTWVWVNSGSWWWTGRPGVLWFMGSQRVRHDWATELNWTLCWSIPLFLVNLKIFSEFHINNTVKSFFLIQVDNLCFVIGVFKPFTLKWF